MTTKLSSSTNDSLPEKLQCLKRMVQQLKSKKDDIQNELRNEELQARKKRKSEVTLWIEQVIRFEGQVQSIETEVAQVGIFAFLCQRQLSDKLDGMKEHGEQLLKQSEFSRGLLLGDFKPLEMVTPRMEGSTPSRVQTQVWSCFERGEVRVAIVGIGGVGKTTLAMHIHKEIVKQKRLFEHVYYVTVSRETSVHKLQCDIAKAFDLRLDYEDEQKRAAELRIALAKREKSLLILDDVWEDITMEEVGVSVEGDGCKLLITTRDNRVCHKMRCCPIHMKPLSPDESWDLFKKQLGNFETLPDEVKVTAASVAEECDGLPLGIVTMAGSMRGETDVHVWRDALRELQNSCTSSHDMEKKIFKILKYSYDCLKKEKHKKCFLYCALYPEDYKIERGELIRHFIALGFLDGANRKESIDEGHDVLNVLENASLLECAVNRVLNKRCVKMHDLVRDMAIKIMGSTTMVIIERRNWKEIFGKEERNYKDLKWVSLLYNKMDRIEDMMPDFPNISVLLLRDHFLKIVPDSFFLKMITLKVLDLSSTTVDALPASVSDLCNLTSLMLSGCILLHFIPSLAKLTKLRELDLNLCERMRELPDGLEELASLEYLDLSHTNVEELPASISDMCNLDSLLLGCCNSLRFIPSLAKLTKLRSLNLFGCENVETLPEGMEELASLEHLDLQGTKIESLHRGVIIKLPNLERLSGSDISVPPEELMGLKHMKNLSLVHFEDVSEFSRCVGFGWFNQLETYHVSIGDSHWCAVVEEEDGDDTLSIKAVCWNGVSGGEESFLFPQNVSRVEYTNCNFVGGSLLGVLPSLVDATTTDLELCCVSDDFECIIPEGWEEPIQGIRKLVLEELNEFGGLIKEEVVYPYISFSGLRVLKIYGCPKLKKLWMLNLDLPNLEEIGIYTCKQMEEIFATEKGGTIKLPRLRCLELVDLPELRSMSMSVPIPSDEYQLDLHFGGLHKEEVVYPYIFFSGLRVLEIYSCPKLKKLWMLNLDLPNLEEIEIDYCGQMEEIFATEKGGTIKLPRLRCLKLVDLPELRSMSMSVPIPSDEYQLDLQFGGLLREEAVYPYISFSDLRMLEIRGCEKLKKLWMLNLDLPNLEEIAIAGCGQMEEIFATENGRTVQLPKLRCLELEDMPELRSIWGNCEVFFPHLESLKVSDFQKMKKIGRVSRNLSSLKTISVSDCKEMEEIFAAEDEAGGDQIHLPKLEELELDDLPQLRSISRQTIVCNSLQRVSISATVSKIPPELENCPISVPSLSASGPLPNFSAFDMPIGWWESLRWNDPATLSNFHQLNCFSYWWNLSMDESGDNDSISTTSSGH